MYKNAGFVEFINRNKHVISQSEFLLAQCYVARN
jgi:hypothetical protein